MTDDELRAVYDLMKFGPTSANCSPARFVFVRTPEAKEKLKPALSAGNLDKTMAAPVTVIVAYDPKFYDHLPKLFPPADARAWFSAIRRWPRRRRSATARCRAPIYRGGARRWVDIGPMSGFDKAKVDEIVLSDNGWKSNFLINLGHGDPESCSRARRG